MAPKAEDILVVLPGDGSEGAPVIFDKKMTYKRAFKFMKTHALEKAYVNSDRVLFSRCELNGLFYFRKNACSGESVRVHEREGRE